MIPWCRSASCSSDGPLVREQDQLRLPVSASATWHVGSFPDLSSQQGQGLTMSRGHDDVPWT